MHKCLITGAAGFLGYAIAHYLRRAYPQAQLTLVDDLSRGAFDGPMEALCAQDNVTFHQLDLAQAEAVAGLPRDYDYVFHMAALNGTQNFYERPLDVVGASTLPTVHLLRHLADSKTLARFVYAGSSEAYAGAVTRFGWPVPTGENVPLVVDDVTNPRWSYGASKLHGEAAVVAANAQHGLPVRIVRFHNVYGPRMGDKHVVPDFLERLRGGRAELFGGENTRSFLYIADAVEATVEVATAPQSEPMIVNVGGDEEVTMAQLARMMLRQLGFPEDELVVHAAPQGSVARRCPDVGRLRASFGCTPRWSLEAGLREAARWYYERVDNVSDGTFWNG